jgi:hypothetical protein
MPTLASRGSESCQRDIDTPPTLEMFSELKIIVADTINAHERGANIVAKGFFLSP